MKTRGRWLKAGDPIPVGAPKRSIRKNGYVELSWKLDGGETVRVYEHQFVAGLGFEVVHHINGNKSDNRPENLAPQTRSAHALHHFAAKMKFDRDEASAMYRAGWTLKNIGLYYSVHPVTVMCVLRRLGVWKRQRPTVEVT